MLRRKRSKPQPIELSQHEMSLGGQAIRYMVRRSKRRTMGLTVDAQGLRVAVPWRTSTIEVDRFLAQHADWIVDKLARWQTHVEPPRIELRDGASFPYLGQQCTLRLMSGKRAIQWVEQVDGPALWLTVPAGRGVSALFWQAIESKALEVFAMAVQQYCRQIRCPMPAVRLSNALTRWGSCSRKSGIRLSWRLIFLARAEMEYVVAHEVAHLLEMNHGPRFWAVVNDLCPDYLSLRTRLRDAGARIPEFS